MDTTQDNNTVEREAPEVAAPTTARDAYILEKAKNFSPVEIIQLMEREGFKPVTHSWIYQLCKKHGVTPVTTRPHSFGRNQK